MNTLTEQTDVVWRLPGCQTLLIRFVLTYLANERKRAQLLINSCQRVKRRQKVAEMVVDW